MESKTKSASIFGQPKKKQKKEAKVHDLLMEGLAPYLFLERIESHQRSGVPDIFYGASTNSGWIEVKDCPGGLPSFIPLRKAQQLWWRRYAERGCRGWIILRIAGRTETDSHFALFSAPLAFPLSDPKTSKSEMAGFSQIFHPDPQEWGRCIWSLMASTLLHGHMEPQPPRRK